MHVLENFCSLRLANSVATNIQKTKKQNARLTKWPSKHPPWRTSYHLVKFVNFLIERFEKKVKFSPLSEQVTYIYTSINVINNIIYLYTYIKHTYVHIYIMLCMVATVLFNKFGAFILYFYFIECCMPICKDTLILLYKYLRMSFLNYIFI